MYIKIVTPKRNRHPMVQVVETFREGGKVRQRRLTSLGTAKTPEDLARLRASGEEFIKNLNEERRIAAEALPDGRDLDGGDRGNLVDVSDLEHLETVYDGYVTAVEKVMEIVGFDKILPTESIKCKYSPTEILQIMIAQRLCLPASKLRTFLRQKELGFFSIPLQAFYRSMDIIGKFNDDFQKAAYNAAQGEDPKESVECILYDVTTLYFESEDPDELRAFGYSKDQKFHCTQILLCLVVNKEGLPVAYQVFRGNTGEVTTLLPVMEEFRKRYNVEQATVVCDRAMGSAENLKKLNELGFSYVIGCKIKKLPAELGLNDLRNFEEMPKEKASKDDSNAGTLMIRILDHPTFEKTRLIVTYSSKRAKKDAADRERLLDKLRKKQGKDASSGTPRKIVSNSGYKQFVKFESEGKWKIDDAAVEKASSWDGFHAIAVSTSGTEISAQDALKFYRGLWRVEEDFRVAKCTLRTRPIFHRMPRRIRSHVLICFLTLFVERYLEFLLRREKTPLTPDRIRHALGQVHRVTFRDRGSGRLGRMESSLSPDAKVICKVLGIPTRRGTGFKTGPPPPPPQDDCRV